MLSRLVPSPLAALALALLGLGCSVEPGGEGVTQAEGTTPAATKAPTKLKTFASTILLADDVLYALGPDIRSRTVAVSALSDDPRYSEQAGQWPASLPRVGPNPAEIVALDPDVVFLASFSDQAYRAALDEHFELVVLESFAGFDDYRANLRIIAQALGGDAGVRAESLIVDFDARLARIESGLPKERMSWPTCVSYDGGYVAGLHTSFDDAAGAAGCRNLVAEAQLKGHQAVDTEQLLAWAPDYLVVSCAGPKSEDCERRRVQLGQMAGISELEAVERGRLVTVAPAELSSVGEGMLDLTVSLAAALRASPSN